MSKMKSLSKPLSSVAAVAISLVLASCASPGVEPLEVTKGLVVRNVNIVNTRDGSTSSQMAVVIEGGSIRKIAPDRAIRTSGTVQTVDGSGKYLVPGFLDMHTHAMAAADQPITFWPLLIANGITGIREMAGSPEVIKRVSQLNADSAAGRVDAPEVLLVSGPLVAGIPAPAIAIAQVQQQKAMGAGFVKIVAGSRDVILAVLAEAKAQGLGVAGHLSLGVTAIESSEAGWRAIEHLGAGMGILLDCATDAANIRQAIVSGGGAQVPFSLAAVVSPLRFRALDAPFYQRIMDTYNEAKCQEVSRAFVKNETWQVPTLIRVRTMAFSDDQGYRTDPNLAYIDKGRRALWEGLAQQYSSSVPAPAATIFRQYYSLQEKLTKSMKQSGVKMLTGSDLGGIWVIPGFSLHQEFKALAAAGLSPLEILQMTTLNGAQFMNREASMGTVDEGKNADLVLLDANPVEAVANLDRIAAVVLKGKYFSKDALDKMKSDVASAYKN